KEMADNTPYDQFVRKILTATGSNKENPAASYWKILREPAEAMENTTHLFLGTRFNCNKCHDHPFERWTQDQDYHLGAFFSQVSLQEDPHSEGKRVGGSDVEGAKPLFELVADTTEGDVKHDRTGKVSPPSFPFEAKCAMKEKAARGGRLSPSLRIWLQTGKKEAKLCRCGREQLATWITTPENQVAS